MLRSRAGLRPGLNTLSYELSVPKRESVPRESVAKLRSSRFRRIDGSERRLIWLDFPRLTSEQPCSSSRARCTHLRPWTGRNFSGTRSQKSAVVGICVGGASCVRENLRPHALVLRPTSESVLHTRCVAEKDPTARALTYPDRLPDCRTDRRTDRLTVDKF